MRGLAFGNFQAQVSVPVKVLLAQIVYCVGTTLMSLRLKATQLIPHSASRTLQGAIPNLEFGCRLYIGLFGAHPRCRQ